MGRISEVILASSSKYRHELLGRLVSEFRAMSPDVDETEFHAVCRTPEQLASRLAYEKAAAISRQFPNAIVIGSDQLVDIDNRILGKPGTMDTAISQLMALSGRSHRLLTAVCVLGPERKTEFRNETRLSMRPLSREEAKRYVERDEPLDCAGSYRIESLGIALFDRVETDDFTAIMGLPLIRLSQVLRENGIAIP
jgi:septum formation protein